MTQTLGEAGEAVALTRIFPRLPAASAQLLGPGDDAAVLATPDGRVVITTDMMIHGPDFRLAWSSAADLGWKAAASNLADVAAMGARPTALVVALAAPASTTLEWLEQLADGLRDGCDALAPGCGVVGGDLSVSDTLTIAVTAFGDLEGRAPVLRSGARPGDVVAVSGELGLAAEGLRLLFEHGMEHATPNAASAARVRAMHPVPTAAQLTPTPPIADGVAAALAGATAMLDLSDGLAIDARRIAAASAVALDLDHDGSVGLTPTELDGGEDHALLATFPTEVAAAGLPGGFRAIGVVRDAPVDAHGMPRGELLVGGQPYLRRGGWDPYDGWDGGAG